MVKDSSRDGNIKKKRKTATTEPEPEVDIYKKSIDFEEKEALARDANADAELYFKSCREIAQLLNEIGDLKQKNASDPKIEEKTTEACLKIVLLKKLNRMEKVRMVAPKEQLAIEKQKVDSIHLQYQNLLYEANHLSSEYRKCFQFKSKDEHIELVPVEEFLQEAPETLTKKFKDTKIEECDEVTKHELRLARLEWELQQRINLAETCKKLEEERKKLELDISERKTKLEKLAPLLANVMEATKPVQEHLGLRIDKIKAEHKLASLLPSSLYLFYVNVDAYRQVNDTSMTVEILGDQDEALQFRQRELESSTSSLALDLDDENDQSDPEGSQDPEELVEEVVVKKRRHRKSAPSSQQQVIDPMEEKKKQLLQLHPLSVQVTITTKNNGPNVKVKFSHLIKLNLISAHAVVDVPDRITGNSSREVLSNDNFLTELILGDFGLESPNPSTSYQLKKVGLSSFKSLVGDVGHVYVWAQNVCGMDFLAKEQKKVKVDERDRLSQSTVEQVMVTIKRRLRYRFDLAQQLEQLERNVIPLLPPTVDLPKTTVSTLTKWSSVTYQTYRQSANDSFNDTDFITPNDIFYLATISRGNATLQAFVIIKNNHPASPPIFSLILNHKDKKHSLNDDNVRDMERLVNVDWTREHSKAPWLLSAQITSLCVALDIYVETEDPQNFQQNTMYIRSSCSRNRRKPFKFRNIGVGVFTQ